MCVKLKAGEETVLLTPTQNPLMPYKSVGACGAGMDAVVTNWPQAGDMTCKPSSAGAKPAKPEPPQRPFCISIKNPGNKYDPVCDCCYDGKTLGLMAGAGSCDPSLCAGSLR